MRAKGQPIEPDRRSRFLLRVVLLLCALVATPLRADEQELIAPGEAEGAPLFEGDEVDAFGDAGFSDGLVEEEPYDDFATSTLAMGKHDFKLLPFDWVRHVGFRHSSTHGRNVGKGLPLKGASWLNRPYHIDWFAGTVLMDDFSSRGVNQNNTILAGLRVGRDIDHFWGLEGRLAWADAKIRYPDETPLSTPNSSSYSLGDFNLLYYPWGDSKVRPYGIVGMGFAKLDFRDTDNIKVDNTYLTMPFGVGVKLYEWPSVVIRLEVLDNWSFGGDRTASMHNFSFTGGMEFRYGARRRRYWPWRSDYVGW